MSITLILLLALSLSTDSFAVSLGVGISTCKFEKRGLRLAVIIGVLHFIFCASGVLFFSHIGHYVEAYGHYVAFALLAFLGLRMVVESFKRPRTEQNNSNTLKLKNSLIIGIAVSLDAFIVGGAVGVANSYTNFAMELPLFCGIIGTTAALSVIVGIALGCRMGRAFRRWATLIGGLILIGLAIKFLLT